MKRDKKNIHGIILLDKPTGMSSNRALQTVKHLFNARKAGHTGSLDPLATGLLPICLGQATKVSEYLLHSHKKYTTTIKLGETTDTLDSEGKLLESREVNVSETQLQAALEHFRGDIQQVPPMFSALKKDGQPLYKLARKGESIERTARAMTVYSLDAFRVDHCHVELKVHCSSGFYIRSLAHDLGQELNCGAHVVKLRRTEIKNIGLEQALSLEELAGMDRPEVAIQPIDHLICDMPIIKIDDLQAQSLGHGKITKANPDQLRVAYTDGLSRLYTQSGRLFGIGRVDENSLLKAEKMFITGD